MAHGWTSHLSIWDSAGSVEHKVDLFSKPPRVRSDELQIDPEGWATGHVVAQMKRTDRDKDWPIINGLGRRLWHSGVPLGVLHLMEFDALGEAWGGLDPETRAAMVARRPLLKAFEGPPALTRPRCELLLMVERLVWERVNRQRYSRYTAPWKQFYRRWRHENPVWPTDEPFAVQHTRLLEAARAHGLPINPLADAPAAQLVQAAVQEILALERFTEQDVAAVLPPVYELLP